MSPQKIFHCLNGSLGTSIGLGLTHSAVLWYTKDRHVLRHMVSGAARLPDGFIHQCNDGALLVTLVNKLGEARLLDEVAHSTNSMFVSALGVHNTGEHLAAWVKLTNQHFGKLLVLVIAHEAIIKDQ